jgi:hypothetical protein
MEAQARDMAARLASTQVCRGGVTAAVPWGAGGPSTQACQQFQLVPRAVPQSSLECREADVTLLQRQLEAAQAEGAALQGQMRDLQARLEAAAEGGARLAGQLADEQRATAAARDQEAERATQVRVGGPEP